MAPTESLDEILTSSTPESAQKGMDDWMQWAKKHEKDIVELGAPAGKNKRVVGDDVSDLRNEVCGYSIVQADSHGAAAKLFSDNPHFAIPGGYIDVLECLDMPEA